MLIANESLDHLESKRILGAFYEREHAKAFLPAVVAPSSGGTQRVDNASALPPAAQQPNGPGSKALAPPPSGVTRLPPWGPLAAVVGLCGNSRVPRVWQPLGESPLEATRPE